MRIVPVKKLVPLSIISQLEVGARSGKPLFLALLTTKQKITLVTKKLIVWMPLRLTSFCKKNKNNIFWKNWCFNLSKF